MLPVLHPSLRVLSSRRLAKSRLSTEGGREGLGEHLWIMDETYETPEREEMEFSSLALDKVPSQRESTKLHINTHSNANLHERYQSSEEEVSPSPNSETESHDWEFKYKTPGKHIHEVIAEPGIADEYKAEIAIAVPILATGRPKIVDITKLAPMHKRKRTDKPMLPRSAVEGFDIPRVPPPSSEIGDFATPQAHKATTPEDHIPNPKGSIPVPDSWFPDDLVHVVQEEDKHHYFPDLELRKPPSYNDYDPYSLSPPRLSPRNSYKKSTINKTGKNPGNVTRARVTSNSPATRDGWKGLTRPIGLGKKSTPNRTDQQVSKRPKMVARAANEREEPFLIPAFPFEDDKGVDQ